MRCYKLVTQDCKTRKGAPNETTWVIGKTVEAKGEGNKLCTDGVIHAYADPVLAVLLNPIHANISNPRMLVLECSEAVAEAWDKSGHKSAMPIAEIPLPEVTATQRTAFGILCALEVYSNAAFTEWAEAWLDGTDRSLDFRTSQSLLLDQRIY